MLTIGTLMNKVAFYKFLAAACILDGLLIPPTSKKANVCLLPECHATTTHNGGYCSAEHCNIHRNAMSPKKGV